MNKRQKKKRMKKVKKEVDYIIREMSKAIFSAQVSVALSQPPPKLKEGGIVPKGDIVNLPDQVIPHGVSMEIAKTIKSGLNLKVFCEGIDLDSIDL